MAVLHTYERLNFTPAFALNVTDHFATAFLANARVAPALGGVSFSVTNRVQPSAMVFDPPLDLIVWRNRSGFFLSSGEARTRGEAAPRVLAPGTYTVRIDSDYYQSQSVNLVWPPADVYTQGTQHDIALEPGSGYPFPDLTVTQRGMAVTLVRGSLFERGGEPKPGVTIALTAPALPNAAFVRFDGLTDAQGNWAIAILQNAAVNPMPNFANANVNVAVQPAYNAGLAITAGAVTVLRQTAVRGRVVTAQGQPIANAQITTGVATGVARSDADGQWAFYFDLKQPPSAVTVTATAPNGHAAQQATQIVQDSTVVVPAVTIP